MLIPATTQEHRSMMSFPICLLFPEENAAFAEETTASMEELNSTINVMSDTAKDLKNISDDIAEAMTFFKL